MSATRTKSSKDKAKPRKKRPTPRPAPEPPQYYQQPRWRTADSAAAYVEERLGDEDSGLSKALQDIKKANGGRGFAMLLDFKLIRIVEKARLLERDLKRAELHHTKAAEAHEAMEVLADWAGSWSGAAVDPEDIVNPEDLAALRRIKQSINERIAATSEGTVLHSFGSTREIGKTKESWHQDRRAVQLAVGDLAYWIREWDESKPHTTTLATIANALFDPDAVLFPEYGEGNEKLGPGLSEKNIEHCRAAYAKIVREGGGWWKRRWYNELIVISSRPDKPPRSRKRKSGSAPGRS